MKKYVVKRKDVCAGKLLKTGNITMKIYDCDHNEICEKQLMERGISGISFFGGTVMRGMLFNVNENGLANDLIYTTPINYPIDGIKSKIDIESELIIKHYVELEEVLKYLNYSVDLTQRDLNQIFRKLITNQSWLEHHMELFGWEKLYDQKTGEPVGYGSGGVQTIPMSIYDNLYWTSSSKNGKPQPAEPIYHLIKKRK